MFYGCCSKQSQERTRVLEIRMLPLNNSTKICIKVLLPEYQILMTANNPSDTIRIMAVAHNSAIFIEEVSSVMSLWD